MENDDAPNSKKFTFCSDAPINPFKTDNGCGLPLTRQIKAAINIPAPPAPSLSELQIRAFFGDKMPDNYKHVPGSTIFVDPSGYPILKLNDDGTLSGITDFIIER